MVEKKFFVRKKMMCNIINRSLLARHKCLSLGKDLLIWKKTKYIPSRNKSYNNSPKAICILHGIQNKSLLTLSDHYIIKNIKTKKI